MSFLPLGMVWWEGKLQVFSREFLPPPLVLNAVLLLMVAAKGGAEMRSRAQISPAQPQHVVLLFPQAWTGWQSGAQDGVQEGLQGHCTLRARELPASCIPLVCYVQPEHQC